MKILVFSDSHGNRHAMSEVVAAEQPDEVFYLGDGLADLDLLRVENPALPITAVAGNCDRMGSAPWESTVERAGKRFFLTHGHTYSVKSGPGGLIAEAKRQGVDATLFGHTHQPLCEKVNGLWLLNPGSVGWRCSPSYGVIFLKNGQIFCRLTKSDC